VQQSFTLLSPKSVLQKHRERIMNWLIPSFSMLVLAFAMDFFGKHY
jgi:hypothetical protein